MNIHTGNEDEDGVDYSWEIEPQVSLDMEQGVSVKCKPDFVLWPNFADDQEHLPVAVLPMASPTIRMRLLTIP